MEMLSCLLNLRCAVFIDHLLTISNYTVCQYWIRLVFRFNWSVFDYFTLARTRQSAPGLWVQACKVAVLAKNRKQWMLRPEQSRMLTKRIGLVCSTARKQWSSPGCMGTLASFLTYEGFSWRSITSCKEQMKKRLLHCLNTALAPI